MAKLRCQGCGRIVDGKISSIDDTACRDCRGKFEVLGSTEDEYEEYENEDNEEDNGEEDNEEFSEHTCIVCGEKKSEAELIKWDSEDCDDYLDYDDLIICKKCIDKAYPRQAETKIEYKEKIIEKPIKIFVDKKGLPLSNFKPTFNPDNISKFD